MPDPRVDIERAYLRVDYACANCLFPYDRLMRRSSSFRSVGIFSALILGGAACAAGGGGTGGGGAGVTSSGTEASTGSGSGTGSSGATTTAGSTNASTSVGFMTGTGGMPSCAEFTADGEQKSAAMLFVLDKTASMNKQNKWSTAQLAVASAIDNDVFDSMSLGLVTFPVTFTDPPQCLCDDLCAPLGGCSIATCKQFLGGGVSCGTSGLPQIAIAPAGANKSNAPTGVRHDMYQYLVNNSPLSNSDDGSPIYEALQSGYNALKVSNVEARILVLITDGGGSCTSLSNPTRPGYTDGACPDWEYPDTINALISSARTDPNKPIETFVVGVPGSNSNGQMQDGYATPPYQMRLALSTYAVSGSPSSVDPACDKSAVFTQGGAPPATPCHYDLSSGANFNATSLADAISAIRGKALGCVYALPDPPPGDTIDPGKVNVKTTTNGMVVTVPKRANMTDTCDVDPCWDYTPAGEVELLGIGCKSLTSGDTTKVQIEVGCATIVK
jgi:hypothetical protein